LSTIVKEVALQVGGVHRTPSTFAQRYETFVQSGALKQLSPLSHLPWHVPCAIPLPHLPQPKYIPYHASERNVVQPAISAFIQSLNKSALGRNSTQVLVDSHNRVAFLDRKPDIVFYPRGVPQNEFYISALGDVKGRGYAGHEGFSNDAKGQLESFMEELLELQPYRDRMFAFLTDGVNIQFFELERNLSGRFQLIEYPQRTFANGGASELRGLLQAESLALGLPLKQLSFKGYTVELSKYLGQGGAALVYQVFPLIIHFKTSTYMILFCVIIIV
jgi:hypothetical protein